jgi:hypothetical protein
MLSKLRRRKAEGACPLTLAVTVKTFPFAIGFANWHIYSCHVAKLSIETGLN